MSFLHEKSSGVDGRQLVEDGLHTVVRQGLPHHAISRTAKLRIVQGPVIAKEVGGKEKTARNALFALWWAALQKKQAFEAEEKWQADLAEMPGYFTPELLDQLANGVGGPAVAPPVQSHPWPHNQEALPLTHSKRAFAERGNMYAFFFLLLFVFRVPPTFP